MIRWGAVLVLGVILLAGCVWTRTPPTGSTTGSGVNSAFTEAGVELIKKRREATIDLREDELTAADLGVGEGEFVQGVDIRKDGGTVRLTVKGSTGDLVVDVEIIRLLVTDDGRITTMTFFQSYESPGPLADHVEKVGATVGSDPERLGATVRRLRSGQATDGWLNRGRSLGFSVDLHPILKEPGDIPLLEYAVTPPGADLDD